ncbi:MAG: DPP IV N-terminal domain-containing protein [Planctomycetes bacterium]|nr:DPP IV N-terminal domain-containing protein [Planctomycetota bacterium]
MVVPIRAWFPFAFLLLTVPTSAQQATELTLATVLQRGAALVPNPPTVLWLPGGHDATVVRTDATGNQTLHRVTDGAVVEAPIADAKAIRSALQAAGGADAADGPARFPTMQWLDADTLRLETGRSVHRWQLGAQQLATWLQWPPANADAAARAAVAPGDERCAYVHQDQLWLLERSGRRRQLTFDGGPDLVYGDAAHRAEFGIERGLFWSDDGRFLAFYREDLRGVAPYPYQELGAAPRPRAGRYPMAGGAHAKVTIGVLDTTDFGVRWLDGDPAADVYWTGVHPGPGPVVHVTQVERGQDRLRLLRFDATTGKQLAVLLEEQDAEWVEPEHPPTFLPDGRFVWWSQRSGHRHLWLHQADGGNAVQVTKGAFDVQALLGLQPDGKGILFEASGEDPRQRHLFAAGLDGNEVRQLTRERGTHRCTLSPDGLWAAELWSNLETRPTARLLDLATGAATALPQPPDPLAAVPMPTQRLFQVTTDDSTVLYGHLALPPNLAEGQRCPVLLYVYGGPHVQLVTDQWLGGAPLWLQALAAEGYIVCRLDNRGTPNRGSAFEQAVHRRLGVLEVQDQLRAVEWLRQQPFVDGERIGVHGWSYGGYLTLRLLLAAPTTFACGVSGAPVTDWAMYETGYTERYMDLPTENPEGYAVSSCLPYVGELQRPLLLVHGTDDRTVMWSHSLAFVDRAIAAGKQLDYFPYPMQQHALQGQSKQHFLGLLHDWLGKHLRPGERKLDPPKPPPAEPPPAPEAPKKEGGG